MKRLYLQKELIGWEEYVFEVPDDFTDYQSLNTSNDWIDLNYLDDASELTGKMCVLDKDYNIVYEN